MDRPGQSAAASSGRRTAMGWRSAAPTTARPVTWAWPGGVEASAAPGRRPAGSPALSAPAETLQPDASAAARTSARRAPAYLGLMPGSRQGDVQLEDGPVRREREYLTTRAEEGRIEQGVGRARPFRGQPVGVVVDQRGPAGLRAAARDIRVPGGVDRRGAHVSGG